jgi:hypothetical protein
MEMGSKPCQDQFLHPILVHWKWDRPKKNCKNRWQLVKINKIDTEAILQKKYCHGEI